MSLDRCIKATAGELGLDEGDVRAIAKRLEKHRKRLAADGRLDTIDADLRKFAGQAAEQARIEAIKKRQHAALNVVLRSEWERDLAQLKADGLSPRDAIVAKLVGVVAGARGGRVSASARRVALEGKWLLGVEQDLVREAPILMRQLKDAAGIPGTLKAALSGKLALDPDLQRTLDDIVREMAELREGGRPGSTGNTEAQKAAAVLRTRSEEARIAANKAGANIGRLDGWAGPQNHDADRLRAAGEERWLAAIKPLLDLERSFPGVDPDELDEVLRNVFYNVVTGRDRRLTAGQMGQRTGPANLARSMEKHRVLHFRDADAWLDYARQFGSGNVVGDMLDHLHRMARTVANMQAMGPNPQVFLEALIEDERVAARAAAPGKPDEAIATLQDLKADLDRATGLIGRSFAEVMGDTYGVHHLNAAKITSGVRAFTSMAKLGGALISSVTDLVTYAAAARFQGRGLLAGYADGIRRLFEGRTSEEQRRLARALGVFADASRDDILTRFDAAENLPGRTTAAMSAFFRLSGLTWWTNRLKSGFARMMGASMGEDAAKAFGELDERFRHVLGLHGIDEARWDVLRQAVSEQADGRRYILPDDVAGLDDAALDPLVAGRMAEAEAAMRDGFKNRRRGLFAAEQAQLDARRARLIERERYELEMRLRELYSDETSFAVLEPDDRVRSMLVRGTQRGTIEGEAWRFLTQFKAFPVAYTYRVLGRARYGGKGIRPDYGALPNIIAGSLVLGYVAMTAKDFLKNRTPKDPTNPETWVAAMLQGGGLGLYGDFVFGQYDRFGGGLPSRLFPPAGAPIGDLYDLFQKVRAGDVKAGDAFYPILNATPFLNLWWARSALDLAILNQIQEWISPGSLRRRERKIQQQFGQSYVVDPTPLSGASP